MANLTEYKAKQIKAGDKPLADGQITGLRLLPSSRDGNGKWQLRYVSPITGKRRDMGLGSYPEVSISNARTKAFEARNLILNGQDPIEIRRIAEASRLQHQQATMSFREAAISVHQEFSPSWKNSKHADQWINTLKTYVFDQLGDRQVDSLKPSDFAAVLRPIWLNKQETANRVKQRCHTIMKWCWGNELVQGNPLDIVDTLLPKQTSKTLNAQHLPAMPWSEIPAFVKNYLQSDEDVTRHLLEFTILTAVRSGESRGAKWNEIDFDTSTWTIPAERMKAGKPHRVPLSTRAIEILLKRQVNTHEQPLVFPSPRGKMLSDMSLSSFLRRHNAVSDTPGRTATAHGFRSSFRDWCSEHQYPRDLAERALAHTIKSSVEAAYHRTDLLEQRRAMMESWAQHVSGSTS